MAFALEKVWYGLIAMTVVMMFAYGFYGYNLSTYDVPGDNSKLGAISSSLKNSYDQSTLDMKSKIEGDSISGDNAVNNMVGAGYTAVRNNPFKAASLGLNATQTIISESNLINNEVLPLYTILVSLLTISIIFGIIYLIMRFRAS